MKGIRLLPGVLCVCVCVCVCTCQVHKGMVCTMCPGPPARLDPVRPVTDGLSGCGTPKLPADKPVVRLATAQTDPERKIPDASCYYSSKQEGHVDVWATHTFTDWTDRF